MRNPQKSSVATIDDYEGVRNSVARMLQAADLHPFSYCSAEAFLADPKCFLFHCLVIDIPGISGLELCEKPRALGCDTPIIFNTGQDNPALRRRAEALGCAGFFLKVLPSDDLLAAVRRAVAGGAARTRHLRGLTAKRQLKLAITVPKRRMPRGHLEPDSPQLRAAYAILA